MYKISFYVPISDAEKVKNAMFSAGAGIIGDYDRCCWETAGIGQFRPLQGSHPSVGTQNSVERLEELKVEMVCDRAHLKNALNALISSHPYEEAAYGFWEIGNLGSI